MRTTRRRAAVTERRWWVKWVWLFALNSGLCGVAGAVNALAAAMYFAKGGLWAWASLPHWAIACWCWRESGELWVRSAGLRAVLSELDRLLEEHGVD